MSYFLAAAIAPFFFLVIKSVALWITRRWFPGAEKTLFSPISSLRKPRPLYRRP